MGGDELADGVFGEVTFAGDASHLELGGGGSDVGVEAGGGGGDEVDGDVSVGVVELVGSYVAGHAVDELFIGRGVVGAAGVRCIVAVASRGWAGVEVGGGGEVLSDDVRADEFSVFSDQLSVGLVVEEELGYSGDDKGVDEAEEDGGDCGEGGGGMVL